MSFPVVSFIGLILLALFLKMERDAAEPPMLITMVGVVVTVTCLSQMLFFGADLIANQNSYVSAAMMARGVIDGGYLWQYNTMYLGGAGAYGEKPLQILGFILIFPAWLASCMGFLRMRRWGYQHMIVFSVLGIYFWLIYSVNMLVYGEQRFTGTLHPVWGWWIFNGVHVLLPVFTLIVLFLIRKEEFID